MKDYYKIFSLKKNSSQWRLIKRMERFIKSDLARDNHDLDALVAFRIVLSENAKKLYDLNISVKPGQLRSWAFIQHYIDETPKIVAAIDLKSCFSERHFLITHWEVILNRTFGFDFVWNGLGKRSNSGELEYAGKTSVAAMRFYFYFYFGIPLLFGYHVNQWFYLLALPIILIKVFKEYKRVKTAYYQSLLQVDDAE
jgi:hypothetical protein